MSNSEPSSQTTRKVPERHTPRCRFWQEGVPTIGFMSTDHRQPGGVVTRAIMVSSSDVISSRTPPTVRSCSGVDKLFRCGLFNVW
jgi:hypothetical protein